MKKIVSAKWLQENLNNPNLIILDASIERSADGTQVTKYEDTIPHARRFDIKNVFSDTSSPFPNTILKPKDFETAARKLGINQNSEIIVIDNRGIYTSPRVWWMFNVMGHKNIAVLDGGLPNWIENGYQTSKGHLETFEPGDFKAKYESKFVFNFDQIKRNVDEKNQVIIDARSEGRFNGAENEPRKHLKSGKIPNSINIPYQDVLNNGSFKDKTELKNLFSEKCDDQKEMVFSCGSGLTACIVMLAYQIACGDCKNIYDGSWTEWAELNNLKNDV